MNIEHWQRVNNGEMVDVAQMGAVVIRGRIYGHPTIPNGMFATIRMEGYSFRDEAWFGIDGYDYRLKEIDTTYDAQFRGAEKKLNRMISECRFLLPYIRAAA